MESIQACIEGQELQWRAPSNSSTASCLSRVWRGSSARPMLGGPTNTVAGVQLPYPSAPWCQGAGNTAESEMQVPEVKPRSADAGAGLEHHGMPCACEWANATNNMYLYRICIKVKILV